MSHYLPDGLVVEFEFRNALASTDRAPRHLTNPAEVVYLIEATVYDPAISGTRVLRYCTGRGYTLDGQYYEPRIKHPGRLKRALFSEGRTGGPSQTGYGEVVLVNTDGGLDHLISYGFSGRTLMIKRALAIGAALTAVVTLAACSMEQPTCTWDEIGIRIRDRQQEFSVPLQPNKYGGGNNLPNGLDGTADIAGQPKPLLFGRVKNVTPVCVNTARLIYQVHDGALSAVDGVYDRGVALIAGAVYASQADMEANAPQPGQYRAWLEGGYVRLGASPAGLVTVDAVEGTSAADRSAARLAERMAVQAPTIAAEDLHAADIAALHTANPAELGYYASAEMTVGEALDAVLGSVGGWYGFDATGALRCGRLEPPSAVPIMELVEADILSISRVPTRDEGRGVPAWRVELGYQRNWSPATTGWAHSLALLDWQAVSVPVLIAGGAYSWTAMTHGADLFVAVMSATSGPTVMYATSPDGVQWTARGNGVMGGYWRDIVYANGVFIMLARDTNQLLTSINGINWTQRSLPLTQGWGHVAYGNGRWVAVAHMGSHVAVSTDNGVTWSAHSAPFAQGWGDLVFADGVFVLVGPSKSYASVDGITWTQNDMPVQAAVTLTPWPRLAHGNGVWVALSSHGIIAGSFDGYAWDSFGLAPAGYGARLIFADGYFFAIGPRGYMFSRDGRDWTPGYLPESLTGQLHAAAYGRQRLAVLTATNTAGAILDLAQAPERLAWLKEPSRTVEALNEPVADAYLVPAELKIDTVLHERAAAQAEAERLLALHSVARDRLRLQVPREIIPSDILGQVVRLRVPRYGYQAGKLFICIGIEEDLAAETLILDLWG